MAVRPESSDPVLLLPLPPMADMMPPSRLLPLLDEVSATDFAVLSALVVLPVSEDALVVASVVGVVVFAVVAVVFVVVFVVVFFVVFFTVFFLAVASDSTPVVLAAASAKGASASVMANAMEITILVFIFFCLVEGPCPI